MTDNPTAIYPDVDRLWNTHKSLPFECDDQDCMTLEGFKAALNEAEQRAPDQRTYCTTKCAEQAKAADEWAGAFSAMKQLADSYCAEICELHNERDRLEQQLKDAQAEGRRQGLEEAAKVVGCVLILNRGPHAVWVACVKAIRALLDSQNASPAQAEEK